MAFDKIKRRQTIKFRIRNKVFGTEMRPRLSVFRSNKHIFAQIINDVDRVTIASASTTDKNLDTKNLTKVERAKKVGAKLAEAAKSVGIQQVVFDRGGYLYHGRVKALGDAARESGLKF